MQPFTGILALTSGHDVSHDQRLVIYHILIDCILFSPVQEYSLAKGRNHCLNNNKIIHRRSVIWKTMLFFMLFIACGQYHNSKSSFRFLFHRIDETNLHVNEINQGLRTLFKKIIKTNLLLCNVRLYSLTSHKQQLTESTTKQPCKYLYFKFSPYSINQIWF